MKSTIATPRFLFLSIVILIAAMSRVFPHIPNFTPIAAMALFGGVNFKSKPMAFLVPLIAMFISDCCLQLTTGYGFHNTIAYVYASFALTTLLGMYVGKSANIRNIFTASLLSSVLFFIITNFGCWAAGGFQEGATGLTAIYIAGIPFFGPTLVGDLFFNGILFGSFYLAQRRLPALTQA
jgi:hypothetical protein